MTLIFKIKESVGQVLPALKPVPKQSRSMSNHYWRTTWDYCDKTNQSKQEKAYALGDRFIKTNLELWMNEKWMVVFGITCLYD